MVGYGGRTINTLRLWSAGAPDSFHFHQFSHGDFVGAVTETLAAESITRVLYPDDSTAIGQELRFLQEYFLCACSMHDIVRRFRANNTDWNLLPEKVAVQLNDTHPTISIAELMRILLDDAGLGWDQAWDITQRTFGYTNHTLLPEALERWPVSWFEDILPRHLEIIYEINRRFLDQVRGRYPGDEGRVSRMSLIEEGPAKKVRMANLAIVGFAQHQRRRGHSYRTAEGARGSRLRADVPGALQQQDERRDAAALAAAGQPFARRTSSRKPSATAGSPT